MTEEAIAAPIKPEELGTGTGSLRGSNLSRTLWRNCDHQPRM